MCSVTILREGEASQVHSLQDLSELFTVRAPCKLCLAHPMHRYIHTVDLRPEPWAGLSPLLTLDWHAHNPGLDPRTNAADTTPGCTGPGSAISSGPLGVFWWLMQVFLALDSRIPPCTKRHLPCVRLDYWYTFMPGPPAHRKSLCKDRLLRQSAQDSWKSRGWL